MSQITLYKYRALSGDGVVHFLDAIINQRIYLANCDEMNDPNEGSWEYSDSPTITREKYLEAAKELRKIVDATRVTCFTKECTNPLLWAHYGGGFSGVVFEYKFDTKKFDIRPIEYKKKIQLKYNNILKVINNECLPQDIGILRRKDKCWIYEEEYRLFGEIGGNDKYISCRPTRLIFGTRNLKYDNILIQIARKYRYKIGYLMSRKDEYYIFE